MATGSSLTQNHSRSQNPFPVRALVTSQRSSSFVWENTQTRHSDAYVLRRQPLTSHDAADSVVTGAVPTPISVFKIHRLRRTRTNSRIVIPASSKQKYPHRKKSSEVRSGECGPIFDDAHSDYLSNMPRSQEISSEAVPHQRIWLPNNSDWGCRRFDSTGYFPMRIPEAVHTHCRTLKDALQTFVPTCHALCSNVCNEDPNVHCS
ncbi:hypothetical protein TNCV_5064571 [Trichonephila clavipes]|nr:hypothetical protein TNCV_5064571 [Trichonephila clavipes]